ncbi:DUF1800 domain-containing protein [uncultured Massilia sp.]|uniref:DUF1800 domain-containing protein n=1 Tax=uncultured Massilia sp. TaxID=169973 RepID=UPI0025E9551D|nr:DUF1800 domain-containing protein [uncultured Massilia sp.]
MIRRAAFLVAASLVIGSAASAPAPAPAAPQQATAPAPDWQAVHVLNRLAFGPRPGDVERVRRMGVQAWIAEQLHPERIPLPPDLQARLDALETVNRSAGDALAEFLELRRDARMDGEQAQQARRQRQAQVAREAAEARLLRAIDSPRQLEEVMVDFWFNHFNVFSGKGITRALVASYERDAIRPYALGTFRDLLGATAKHPAMLFYLDNAVSSAPRAEAKGKAAGLNENYARELMELHTLGADGGYTQRDVTELARMLTGWTFDQRRLARTGETFRFDERRHDQGAKTWLGRDVAPAGQREGEQALDVLAVHPSTAHHVSFELAQYFVADAPPPALVERMAASWTASGGDIRTVLATLFASPEFMDAASAGAKFKTPYQFVVSAARASAVPVANVGPLVSTMSQLGMPLHGCQTPDGYKNTQDAWLNPDALTRRITFATALASGRMPLAGAPPASAPPLDAAALRSTLAAAISPRTLDAARRQPDTLQAAMLLGSPDFMLR